MEILQPDKIWLYKNFNMGTELNIAGEFIYNGIHTLNQIYTVNEEAQLFSFLYHTSIGIERLQKIIIVLFETISLEEKDDFEKSLITHSHTSLHERIKKTTNIELSARENMFLHMLTSFYNSARYDRFNLESSSTKERELFCEYLTTQIPENKIQRNALTNHILITPHIKEIIGRTIGSLSKKYFNLVREGCKNSGTYTYELKSESKAEKVFLSTYYKDSLQMQMTTEEIAMKELLVYLRKAKGNDPLLYYMDSIDPLDFDVAFLNEYIGELSKGNIPQSLIDEVETLYIEEHHSKSRIEKINIIGDSYVDFNYYIIFQCYLLMQDLLYKNIDCLEFTTKFLHMFNLIDKYYGFKEFDDIPHICTLFIENHLDAESFRQKIKPYFLQLEKTFN